MTRKSSRSRLAVAANSVTQPYLRDTSNHLKSSITLWNGGFALMTYTHKIVTLKMSRDLLSSCDARIFPYWSVPLSVVRQEPSDGKINISVGICRERNDCIRRIKMSLQTQFFFIIFIMVLEDGIFKCWCIVFVV